MYEIFAYNKTRTQRRAITAEDCGEFTGSSEVNGNFSDWSLPVTSAKASVLQFGDCVEAWHGGAMRHRGYVTDIEGDNGDTGSAVVKGYGRSFDTTFVTITGWLQYPDKVDVSQAFSDIAAVFVAEHTDVTVYTEGIGLYIDYLDTDGKTVKQALDALLDYCRSLATWGFDVDPDTGADRLYFRRRKSSKITVEVPGQALGHRTAKRTVADTKNVVTVTGGQPWWPQLVPNASFEVLRRVQDLTTVGSNLIADGSFQNNLDLSPNWTLGGGAVVKQNGHGDPDAMFNDRVVELDGVGEYVQQVRVPDRPIVPGRSYHLGVWYRPEFSADMSAPPEMRIDFAWQSGGVDVGPGYVFESVLADRQAWQLYHNESIVAPDESYAVDGFRIKFAHINGSAGDNRGVIIDGAYLTDGTVMYPEGWRSYPYGSAVVHADYAAVGVGVGLHGRTALYIKVSASDVNNQDVQYAYGKPVDVGGLADSWQGYTSNVIGGKTYRYSIWARFEEGWDRGKIYLGIKWRDQNGGLISRVEHPYSSWGAFDMVEWQNTFIDVTAPNNAVGVETYITFRGDFEGYIDCLSLRDTEDPYVDTFLPNGSLSVTYSVLDLLTPDDGEAYNSISLYGRRATTVTVSDIAKIENAIAWASEYLRTYAKQAQNPPVSIYDWPERLQMGTEVAFVGEDAYMYPDGDDIVRLTCKIGESGLEDQVELGRPEPTDDELYAGLLQYQDNAIRSAGAAVSTPAVSSYGGVGSPSGSATVGGDLTGSVGNATVVALNGRPVADVEPDDGDSLVWSDADGAFVPSPASGGVDGSGTGGTFPLWLDTDTLMDSALYQDSGDVMYGSTSKLPVSNTGSAPSGSADFSITGMLGVAGGAYQHTFSVNNSGNNVMALWNKAASNSFSAMTFLRASSGQEHGAVGFGNPDATAAGYPFQNAVYLESSNFTNTTSTSAGAPAAMRLVTTGYLNGAWYQYARLGLEPDGHFKVYPLVNDWATASAAPLFDLDQVYGTLDLAANKTAANAIILRNKHAAGYSAISFASAAGVEKAAIGYGNTGAGFFPDVSYFVGPINKTMVLSQFDQAANSGLGAQFYRVIIGPSGNVITYTPTTGPADADMVNSTISFYHDGTGLYYKRKDSTGTVTTSAVGAGGGGSVTGSGTAQQVAVWSGTSALSGFAGLTRNSTNGQVTVTASGSGGNALTIQNSNASGYSAFNVVNSGGTEQIAFGYGNLSSPLFTDKAYIVVGGGGTQAKRFAIYQSGSYPSAGTIIDRISIERTGHVVIDSPATVVASSDQRVSSSSLSQDGAGNTILTSKNAAGTINTTVIPTGTLQTSTSSALIAKNSGTVVSSTPYDGTTVGANAFDGVASTFFGGTGIGTAYVGLDLGAGNQRRVVQIKARPRADSGTFYLSRMLGGVFQGANLSDFSDAVNLTTVISTVPANGVLAEYAVLDSVNKYRYMRWRGPTADMGGYGTSGDIADIEFYTMVESSVDLRAFSFDTGDAYGGNCVFTAPTSSVRNTNTTAGQAYYGGTWTDANFGPEAQYTALISVSLNQIIKYGFFCPQAGSYRLFVDAARNVNMVSFQYYNGATTSGNVCNTTKTTSPTQAFYTDYDMGVVVALAAGWNTIQFKVTTLSSSGIGDFIAIKNVRFRP